MREVMNFNAGPATLPPQVVLRLRDELLDLEGSGIGLLEHSHRGATYESVHHEAIALVRRVLAVPASHDILLLQGGASLQFAMVPMNLLGPVASADYVITGAWSQKAAAEARLVGAVRIAADCSEADGRFRRVPASSRLYVAADAAYLHVTTNNTITGTQWSGRVETGGVPVVADMSSDICSKPIDVGAFGLIYAGLQKNLGPSGATLVIVRRELIDAGRSDIPRYLQYRTHAAADSLYNTPPMLPIAALRAVLANIDAAGGLREMAARSRQRADTLYRVIDAYPALYHNDIDASARSAMNVVFTLPTVELEQRFLAGSQSRGMVGLAGHRSVGGIRVSLYNAIREAWVAGLASYLREFASEWLAAGQ